MRRRRRSTAAALTTLVLVAIVSLGLLAGFFPHTDDGCKVEIHCLACRWALASTPMMAPLVLPTVSFEVAGAPGPETQSHRLALSAKRPSTRGPPTSNFLTV